MSKLNAKKVDTAIARLVELISKGETYRNAIDMASREAKLSEFEVAQVGYRYDTRDGSTDHNGRFNILNVKLKNADGDGHTAIGVYLLNVGDTFAGFGGSRNGLTAHKTASLIVRTVAYGCQSDRECPLHGTGDTWAWIKRLILREAGVQLPDEE